MKIGQNVCLDQFLVMHSECYDTRVIVTGPLWPSCFYCCQSYICQLAHEHMSSIYVYDKAFRILFVINSNRAPQQYRHLQSTKDRTSVSADDIYRLLIRHL